MTVEDKKRGCKLLGSGKVKELVGDLARKLAEKLDLAKNLDNVLSGARNLFRHKEGGR